MYHCLHLEIKSALLAYSARIDQCLSKIEKQIKSSASFKLCINKFCVHERKDKVKIE